MRRPRKGSQCEIILSFLEHHSFITQLECTERFKITRLAARVYDLRRMGYAVENISSKFETVCGCNPRYGIYTLHKDHKQTNKAE